MINPQKLKEEIIKIAITFPKTIYTSNGKYCFYTYGSEDGSDGGCLIGRAIANLYPELVPMLEHYDNGVLNGINGIPVLDASIDAIFLDLGIEESVITKWISDIQTYQDCGCSWGLCLQKVNRDYNED